MSKASGAAAGHFLDQIPSHGGHDVIRAPETGSRNPALGMKPPKNDINGGKVGAKKGGKGAGKAPRFGK